MEIDRDILKRNIEAEHFESDMSLNTFHLDSESDSNPTEFQHESHKKQSKKSSKRRRKTKCQRSSRNSSKRTSRKSSSRKSSTRSSRKSSSRKSSKSKYCAGNDENLQNIELEEPLIDKNDNVNKLSKEQNDDPIRLGKEKVEYIKNFNAQNHNNHLRTDLAFTESDHEQSLTAEQKNEIILAKNAKFDHYQIPQIDIGLQDLFGGRNFGLYGQFDKGTQKTVHSLITKHGGTVSTSKSNMDSIDIIIIGNKTSTAPKAKWITTAKQQSVDIVTETWLHKSLVQGEMQSTTDFVHQFASRNQYKKRSRRQRKRKKNPNLSTPPPAPKRSRGIV